MPYDQNIHIDGDHDERRMDLIGTQLQGHMASVMIDNLIEGRKLPQCVYDRDYDEATAMRDAPGGWGCQKIVLQKHVTQVPQDMTKQGYHMDNRTGRFGLPDAPPPIRQKVDSKPVPDGAFRGMEMLFPAKDVGGGLVGKKGVIIGGISQSTGCDVQVVRDSYAQVMDERSQLAGVPMKTVEFCGTAEQQINAACAVGECSLNIINEIVLCVPKTCCKIIVGKSGAGIRKLETQAENCSIQVRETSHQMGAVMIRGGSWKKAIQAVFEVCDSHMNGENNFLARASHQ